MSGPRRSRAGAALYLALVLIQGAAARIALPFSPQHARQALCSASARCVVAFFLSRAEQECTRPVFFLFLLSMARIINPPFTPAPSSPTRLRRSPGYRHVVAYATKITGVHFGSRSARVGCWGTIFLGSPVPRLHESKNSALFSARIDG